MNTLLRSVSQTIVLQQTDNWRPAPLPLAGTCGRVVLRAANANTEPTGLVPTQ